MGKLGASIDADYLIVGAGLIGSSVAMHLARKGVGSVKVVDVDLEGALSSSELNAGGVRATWNHPVNADISKISIEYYASICQEIGFRQNGYFWMYGEAAWANAEKALRSNTRLKDLGVQFLDRAEITRRYPFIDKTSDLGGATFSPFDGLLNSNLLKNHYREQARASGAQFIDRTWIDGVEVTPSGPIRLTARYWPERLPSDEVESVLTSDHSSAHSEKVIITAKKLIHCSGAWAQRFAKILGTKNHSHAERRQVSIFECKEVDLTSYGMFVDASGVYFHSEADMILAGFAVPGEPPGYHYQYDGEDFFQEYIWGPLYERSTRFESLKHVTGWAGLYEVSPDHSAIIGPVVGLKNVYEAHSFSGRGAMQSYAAGLGLADLIVHGHSDAFDVGALRSNRFDEGKLVSERLVI